VPGGSSVRVRAVAKVGHVFAVQQLDARSRPVEGQLAQDVVRQDERTVGRLLTQELDLGAGRRVVRA